jgi:hypothetical protein
MHEDDGEPDCDIPRLDKERKLKSFQDDAYCICEIPSEIPPRNLNTPSNSLISPRWKVHIFFNIVTKSPFIQHDAAGGDLFAQPGSNED